jgi:glyoxylase-like metal-dependent hydrolase (beta-lactamase superfamily II)
MAGHEWFHVQTLAPGVWQLTEPGHVCMWLVAGDERAVLIDTGCGFFPLRPLVEQLTSLPVTVLQTHHHIDHVGSSHEFDEVLIHPAGVAGLAAGAAPADLAGYRDYSVAMDRAAVTYAELDRRFFHLQREEHTLRPLPHSLRDGSWAITGVDATGTVDDGDTVDLGGGRALHVLHTPGHSPADLSMELVGEGLLFGGDTVNTGPVYVQNPDSSVAQLRTSLARLATRAAGYRRVFGCHFMRTAVPPSYLAAQVAALDTLLAGEVALTPAVDCVGTPVEEAAFDGFSFFVPVGWRPEARPEGSHPGRELAQGLVRAATDTTIAGDA